MAAGASNPAAKCVVITPYFREPTEKLWRCHSSVLAQSHPADHIMVADGQANPAVDDWNVQHVKLPVGTADSGDTPRLVGLALAYALGYEMILLLDGDNWYEPQHIEAMIATQRRTGAPVVTSPRFLRRLDETIMGICGESDGETFNDFNCYLFTREALADLRVLAFHDRRTAYFTDRILWHHLRQSGLSIARTASPTVNYETTVLAHYLAAGEEPPPQAKAVVYFEDTGQTRALTAEQLAELRKDKSRYFRAFDASRSAEQQNP